ncbi:MAG TPA: SiaB family protein kinase [Rectinemataceae bacterium]|nr:SiaB family protein kinase [Rectinemataceae bacterium]
MSDGFDLYRLRMSLMEDDILICFNGPFSHSIIEEIGLAIRSYLESGETPPSASTDVFAVFVELAQNVQAYADRLKGVAGLRAFDAGTLVIGRTDARFFVSAGNVVARADMEPLAARLEALRGLDKDGLKRLYKERLRAPRASEGGAGLGLIDVARRASEPLRYRASEIDDRHLFFSLTVLV